jgi:hypothetical protein
VGCPDSNHLKPAAQRGKYAARFKEDAIVVVLEPDVAAVLPNSEAVNAALRKVAGLEEK